MFTVVEPFLQAMSGQGNAKEAEEGQGFVVHQLLLRDLGASGATAMAEYSSGSVGIDTKKLPDVPVPKEPLKALSRCMSGWQKPQGAAD